MRTSEKLKNLTDRGLFELIGNDVLGLKYPELQNLIASGVNYKGEIIRDPLDAFALTSKNRFAQIAYTTDDTNLEKKWLNEKVTAKTKLGDLIALISYATESQKQRPKSTFTIYLVTNQRVSSALAEKIMGKVVEDFITVEIIENSIITRFLDTNPEGQYLRKKYLGIDAELLSWPLLKDITDTNITAYAAELFIKDRHQVMSAGVVGLQKAVAELTSGLLLVVGESGSGKSHAAFAAVKELRKAGQIVFRIEPQIIESANNLMDAIGKQLLKEYPKLFFEPVKAATFFANCVIVVDDINRATGANALVEKLISWMQLLSPDDAMKVVCPAWSKNLKAIENASLKEKYFRSYQLPEFSRIDGVELIDQTIAASTVLLSDAEKIELLNDTRNDPLVLTLYLEQVVSQNRYVPNQGSVAIQQFIDERLRLISLKTSIIEYKLRTAIDSLSFEMLSRKKLNPIYEDLQHWFQEKPSYIEVIEAVSHEKLLFYIDPNGNVVFRHDRVRDHLLIRALRKLIVNPGDAKSIIEEPFYAELIGNAIADTDLSIPQVNELLRLNALAVFHSLKFLQAASLESRRTQVGSCIIEWNNITRPTVTGAVMNAICFTLIQFDIANADQILKGLGDRLEINLARFRNGDAEGGVKFFMGLQFFIPAFPHYWRDVILDHVKKNYLQKITVGIQYLLKTQLTEKARPKLYLLVGYFGSPLFLPGLRKQWSTHAKTADLLNYLWAVIQCMDSSNLSILTDAFELWASLEIRINRYGKPDGLRTKILEEIGRCHWDLSETQLNDLIKLLGQEQFREIIYAILHYIDSPVAIMAVVQKIAKESELENSEEYASISSDAGRWDYSRRKVRLSKESRQRLLDFWTDLTNQRHQRYFAFRFWCGNEESAIVVNHLQRVDANDSMLYQYALQWRIQLQDLSVWNEIRKLDDQKEWVISQLYRIWNGEAETYLKEWLDRAIRDKNQSQLGIGLALLQKVERDAATDILVSYWQYFGKMRSGITTALFLATPATKALAKKEIESLGFNQWELIKDYYRGRSEGHFILSAEIARLPEETRAKVSWLAEEFKYAHLHYRMNSSDGSRKPGLEELNSLVPYFSLINHHGLMAFAEYGDRHGFSAWVDQHLAHRLPAEDLRQLRPTKAEVVEELERHLDGHNNQDIFESIKSFYRRKLTRQEFIAGLALFAEKHHSLRGFYLLSICIEEEGSRQDLAILQRYRVTNPEEQAEIDGVLINATYHLFRNRLS